MHYNAVKNREKLFVLADLIDKSGENTSTDVDMNVWAAF